MNSTSQKQLKAPPGRPLGLSLAIILSAGLYAVLPIFQLVVQAGIQERLGQIDSPIEVEGQTLTAGAIGGSFMLVSPAELVIQLLAAALFIVIAILAWRGRPRRIRVVFTVTVLAYASVTAFVTARGLFARADLAAGMSSADELVRQALCGVLVTTILIPLYVVWYINRAPARAYYRGTFLSEGAEG